MFIFRLRRPKEVAPKDDGRISSEVTGEVMRLLSVMSGELERVEIEQALGPRHEERFRKACLNPASTSGGIEMTIPEKPESRLQEYRLTPRGRHLPAGERVSPGPRKQ